MPRQKTKEGNDKVMDRWRRRQRDIKFDAWERKIMAEEERMTKQEYILKRLRREELRLQEETDAETVEILLQEASSLSSQRSGGSWLEKLPAKLKKMFFG